MKKKIKKLHTYKNFLTLFSIFSPLYTKNKDPLSQKHELFSPKKLIYQIFLLLLLTRKIVITSLRAQQTIQSTSG